jgi:aspartate kinase
MAWTVEKIGGTAMLDFNAVLYNVVLRDESPYERLLVVSAYGGITDALLEHKKNGAPGVYAHFAENEDREAWPRAFTALRARFAEHNRREFPDPAAREEADRFIGARLDEAEVCLRRLEALCGHGHFQRDDHRATVREMLASLGEAHSAFNLAKRLRQEGLRARFLDLTGWDGAPSQSLEDALKGALALVTPGEAIPVATGYAHCAEGLMERYDRGYSELTFSRLAVLLGAREAVIHKEFHLSSADPKVVGVHRAVPLGRSNYDVADQLAQLGMEAIHPKAAAGLRLAEIPLRVRNLFEPDHPGTLLTADYRSREPCVEMIAGRERLWALTLYDPDGLTFEPGQVEQTVLEVLRGRRVRPLARDGNANSLTVYLAVSEKAVRSVEAALGKRLPQAGLEATPLACVAAVGSSMAIPGLLAKASLALAEAGLSVRAVQQGPRQVDMRFFVDPEAFEPAVRALHEALVEVHDHGRAIRLAS